MSRPKSAGQKLAQVAPPVELAAWEKRALALLRSMSIEAREMSILTSEMVAIREAKRKPARPCLRLVVGGAQ